MNKSNYTIENVDGVFYVYDKTSTLMFAADSWREVIEELVELSR